MHHAAGLLPCSVWSSLLSALAVTVIGRWPKTVTHTHTQPPDARRPTDDDDAAGARSASALLSELFSAADTYTDLLHGGGGDGDGGTSSRFGGTGGEAGVKTWGDFVGARQKQERRLAALGETVQEFAGRLWDSVGAP